MRDMSIAAKEQSCQSQTASDQILFRCIILLAAIFFCFQFIGSAQEPASAAPSAMEATGEVATTPPAGEAAQSPASQKAEIDAETIGRSVTLRTVIPDILHDQKPIWLFPIHVMEGKHVKPALALTLITAGLIALDPYDAPYFHNSPAFKTYQTGALRGRNTTLIVTMIPVGHVPRRTAHEGFARNEHGLACWRGNRRDTDRQPGDERNRRAAPSKPDPAARRFLAYLVQMGWNLQQPRQFSLRSRQRCLRRRDDFRRAIS